MMKKKIKSFIALFLVFVLIASAGGIRPLRTSAETLTETVVLTLPDFEGAYGIDLNLRLNPEYVNTAKVTGISGAANITYDSYQNGAKLKAGLVATSPFSNDGSVAITVTVSLKKAVAEDTELCKLLQMSVNERIVWQAADCILLSGVADGGIYNTDRTVSFNEGTATLNGEAFASGSSVTADGEYTLIVTDKNGKKRTASFTLDKTAPVITVSSFDTNPSDQPLTVTATANEGTLNQASYTFTQNGSFTFVATDAAGNRTEKTVTVSHLYQTYTPTILNKPANVTVLEGLSLDATGWKLKIDYDNGMTDTFDLTADMISYDTSVPGAATGTVTCGKFTATFAFTVQQKSLTQIRITKNPAKTVYLEGDAFDKTGMEVTAYYDNNTSALISDYTVSGYDPTPGTKTVTVSYGGKSATLTVTVEAKSLVRIEITEKPAKLTYLEGASFDPAGMVVTAYYNNNTSAVISDYTVSGYDSTPGTKTVTVTHGGKTASFAVEVEAKTLTSIKVTKKPAKLTYLEGASFDATGMEVTAYYNNNTSAVISDYTVSGYDSTPGTKTVTVTYGGKTDSFTVSVAAKSLTSIKVTAKPSKLTYIEGTAFDPAGMVVTAYYDNGTAQPVTDYTVDWDLTEIGSETVTVFYGGYSDTFTVTVVEKSMISIDVTTMPDQQVYFTDTAFDATGMVVTGYYDNGTSAVLTGYEVDYDFSAVGQASVTVTYGTLTDTVTVTVKARLTVSGRVTYYNTQIGIAGVTVRLSNGSSTVTDANGYYVFTGLAEDSVTVTPEFHGAVNGAISAYDASLVLQAVTGDTLVLTDLQKIAADVDGDGELTANDASSILKKSIGAIEGDFEGSGREWSFDQTSKTLTLTGNVSDADFQGILLGDVSGNWTANPIVGLE